MGIHKSHSKSNMIYLFNQFGIELNNSQTKNELIQVIESLIKSKSITFKDNDFDIKNYGDLAIHLHNENKECKIDTIQKEIVMTIFRLLNIQVLMRYLLTVYIYQNMVGFHRYEERVRYTTTVYLK